jgi:hypothetical protein
MAACLVSIYLMGHRFWSNYWMDEARDGVVYSYRVNDDESQ